MGVKLQQPLALLHIALPARQVLGMPGIHKKYLESKLLQDVVQRNPINACRLHCDRLHAATAQPLCHSVEIRCEARKPSYWFRIPVGTNGYVVTLISDVDPRRIRMNNLQPGVRRSQTTGKFFLRYSTRFCACFASHPFSPDLKIGTRFGPVTNG